MTCKYGSHMAANGGSSFVPQAYLIKRTVHFRLTKPETPSSYNQTVYGKRETEGRPFAGHAGHARSQDIDAGPFAWVCDRATDSAIVRRSAARRRRLSLPGSAAAFDVLP